MHMNQITSSLLKHLQHVLNRVGKSAIFVLNFLHVPDSNDLMTQLIWISLERSFPPVEFVHK